MKTCLSTTLLASVLLLSGCGGGEKQQAAAPAPPPDDPPGLKIVRITGDDTMKFNMTAIEAAPGESLRVVMKNVGRLPKQSMSHNFVLLKPMSDADLNAFGMAASMAAPTYLPKDLSAVIAHTKMLGPGESDQIDLKAPSEPGEYPFICTFPGHFAVMRGKLIVK